MPELVCYCLRVEKPDILKAMETGCATVEDLSARLRACTGCGACRPDLEAMLRFHREDSQAAIPAPTPPRR